MAGWQPFQQSFFDRMWPLAQGAARQTGIPAQTIFAQSALESNWGRSAPQNNFFGIKGSGGTQQTREYINGQWVTVRDSFRGYGSMAESVQGYVNFITNPNSRRWGDARNASSPEEAARALQAGGYATDPSYANKLMSIIRNMPNPFRVSPTPSANGEGGGVGNMFGDGGMLDRMTVSPEEAANHAFSGLQGVVDRLGEPVKRFGFVFIGIMLVGIAIFTILKGPAVVLAAGKTAAKGAAAAATGGASVVAEGAMEAVA